MLGKFSKFMHMLFAVLSITFQFYAFVLAVFYILSILIINETGLFCGILGIILLAYILNVS